MRNRSIASLLNIWLLMLLGAGAAQAVTWPEGFEGCTPPSLTGTGATWVVGSQWTTSNTQAHGGTVSLKSSGSSFQSACPNVTDGLGGNYTAVTWEYVEVAGAQISTWDRGTNTALAGSTGVQFDTSNSGTGGFLLNGSSLVTKAVLAGADIPIATWVRVTRVWNGTRVQVEVFRTSAAPNGGHYLIITSGTTGAWQTAQANVFDSTSGLLSAAASGYSGMWATTTSGSVYFDDFSLTNGNATTYNASGPTRGPTLVASTNFTLSVTGTLAADTIITPSDGGSGTFIPTQRTLTAGSNPSGTFTYTPASTGTKTISFTNNQGLSNPSNLSYLSLNSYGVTSANWYHSSGGWYSDGGGAMQANNCKASSTYVQSNAPGNYGRLAFTGTIAQLNITESQLANSISVVYSIDGALPTILTLTSSDTKIDFTPSPLTNAAHTIFYQFNSVSSLTNDRWTNAGGPGNTMRVTSFWTDSSSLTALTLRPKVAWFFGDSTTESQAPAVGVWTTYSGTLSFQGGLTQSWYWLVGDALNAEVGVMGYSGTGFATNQASVGNVPTFANSWNKYDGLTGHSRDFTNKPDYAFVCLGTNDSFLSGVSVTSTINTFLTNFRAQCPSTKIFLVIPFGQFRSSEIYASTRDGNTFIIDNGLPGAVGLDNSGASAVCADNSGSFVHPNIWGNEREAQIMIRQLNPYIGGTTTVNVTNTFQPRRGR